MTNYELAVKIVDEVIKMKNSSENHFYMEYVRRVELLINKNSDAATAPDRAEKPKCVCTDFLHFKPDPVPNPDCPLHGGGFKALYKSEKGNEK